MARSPINIRRALRFSVLEVALFLLGDLFIRREIWQLHAMTFDMTSWQEWLLIPLFAIDGAVNGAFSAQANQVENVPAYKNLLKWGTPLFFVLYVGCAYLCERVNFGSFPPAAGGIVRTFGIIVMCTGIFVRIWAFRSTPLSLDPEKPDEVLLPTGPHTLLRHPDFSAKLILLIGLVFVFNVWLPLLALPGIIVLLKWHISDQESFRISQLGEPYLSYRKTTWNLLPYLY